MTILSLNAGYAIILLSVVFFAIASYAVLFSAILPLTGVLVSCLLARCKTSRGLFTCRELGVGHTRSRYSLQVPRDVDRSYCGLLCYRELGGMAILPQFIS